MEQIAGIGLAAISKLTFGGIDSIEALMASGAYRSVSGVYLYCGIKVLRGLGQGICETY